MRAKQPNRLTMLVLLALLLLSLGASKISCATIPNNTTDVPSLQDFKNEITHDPTGVLNSWNTSTSHCIWKGVRCSPAHKGRVVALELPGLNLAGQISPSVGNLSFLKTLNLSANFLSGQLPPLNHLHKLRILDLSSNSLHDVIPDALTNCSNLEKLDLSRNSLSGEIPPRVDLLANIWFLGLSFNDLTGIIPQTISNVTSLKFLGVAYNSLTGSIPDGLGKLPSISTLLLGGNGLSGEIPQALFNQSSLRALGLEKNALGKALPPNMGDALPNLWWLTLGTNMFEGSIPVSLGNASALKSVDLSRNGFSGQIPTSFGRLSELSVLSLQNNNLEARDSQSWEFLSALGNCSSLQELSVLGNQLQGPLPNSIGSLPAGIEQLFLDKNNISGTVPPSIGNLKALFSLGLSGNNFNGTIEEWTTKLTQLQGLFLGSNKFTGPIPSSIGNLSRLSKLYLEENGFEGPIPASLGNLTHLLELYLSDNNLQGEIPEEIGNLKQLVSLHLSSNKLTGEIPAILDQCQGLANLQMDQNFLVGDIPIILGSLNNLVTLNLSHNNLSGTIPATLSDLPLLIELDLSYNHLQGRVPINGVFGNSRNVSLDSNWGLCGGPVSLHLLPCPPISGRMERWDSLVKILIPIFGFMSLVLLAYFLLFEKKTAKKEYSTLPPFAKTFQKVSYVDLAQATSNFSESNLIGRGTYGSVYRGKLKEPDMEVAVKVFNLEMRGAEKSFMSECEALRSIQHRNLLPIITACSTVDSTGNAFKALIYQFMPNGNLDLWIHQKGDGKSHKSLGLNQRLSIAVNIADVLDYLHHDCARTTIHCDLKPSNILLDDDMNAVLGDFGIASFYVDSPSTSTGSIGIKGTIGYIAPEYAGGGRHASTSGDVYSYGIVLLEMMSGKRPTDPMFKDGLDIVNFVDSNFPHQISNVIDAHLMEECTDVTKSNMASENAFNQCSVALLQVALRCAHPSPSERLNMKEIASEMHAIKTAYLCSKSNKCASLD